MTWITVTDADTDKAVFVNAAHIALIENIDNRARISMVGEGWFYVKETAGEVMIMVWVENSGGEAA